MFRLFFVFLLVMTTGAKAQTLSFEGMWTGFSTDDAIEIWVNIVGNNHVRAEIALKSTKTDEMITHNSEGTRHIDIMVSTLSRGIDAFDFYKISENEILMRGRWKGEAFDAVLLPPATAPPPWF